MIQIRCADPKGTLIPLPANAAFVELTDDKGNIAAVISYDPVEQSISVFDGDSPKARRYEQFYNVKFIDKKYNVTDIYKKQTEEKKEL